jgi:prolyl oligopeptidase
MRLSRMVSVIVAVPLACLALAPPSVATVAAEDGQVFTYPVAVPGPQVDTYFGVQVADPYRWLENPDSPQTQAWVQAERNLTNSYLATLPSRASRHDQVAGLIHYNAPGVPGKYGRALFWTETAPGANQPVLYWSPSASAKPIPLLDGNKLAKDGKSSLADDVPSWDAKYVAYAVSRSGSDWETIKIRSVATKKDLPDTIEWVKFSGIAWSPDSTGFYYSAYDKPKNPLQAENKNQRLYFHKMGTPQSADRIAYADPKHPQGTIYGGVDDTAKMLWIYTNESANNNYRLFYQRLDRPGRPVVPLFTEADAAYYPLAMKGSRVWMQTTHDAPTGKVVTFDLARPAPKYWKPVIRPTEQTLTDVVVVGNRLVANYLQDATSRVFLFDRAGHPKGSAELPGLGTASGFSGYDRGHDTYYQFTSYTSPRMVLRLNVQSGRSVVWRQAVTGFDSTQVTTDQVFITSKDGTRVPAFIVHRKDVTPTGANPTILTGYGGFQVSITPGYTTFIASWLQRGGVYVEAILRGGGEYGTAWSEQGIQLHKQNVFDDFIATAQWLEDNGWTDREHLAVKGESNGGLLVGAVLTQRPDLIGAALPGVGVLDMLRYQDFTIGSAWAGDYGTSADSSEMFMYLLGYSPLHNVKPGVAYPPTLITTGDHDDRVVPGHSYKFAATLQADTGGTAPIVIRIDTDAGHGGGTSIKQTIATYTDELAFLDSTIGNGPVVPTPLFTR